VVVLDMCLPDVDGLELLQRFRTAAPETDIIMATGHGTIPKAVEAIQAGAASFLEKPVNFDQLRRMLARATGRVGASDPENGDLSQADDALSDADEAPDGEDASYLAIAREFPEIVTRSAKMCALFELMRAAAPTDASVLIHGQHGTGKELIAAAIHQHSQRAQGPFIRINCAAIPSELLESELFGHRRGAFTGAVADKVGLLELADGGTLLLDEIGEMSPGLQAKLLRVLQDREFRPVGGSRLVTPNFRLLCATNIDLDSARRDGKLREDLFFRINTLTIAVPPLHERPEDIPLLADHFLRKFSAQHGRSVEGFAPEVASAFVHYPWPGNVRELENVIERGVIVAQHTKILFEDLPAQFHPEDGVAPSSLVIPPHHTLADLERMAILQTLERTNWNKRAAANILGVYRPTLYNKLKKYKLWPKT
jgi:DNA-binding NtrC family response regulator